MSDINRKNKEKKKKKKKKKKKMSLFDILGFASPFSPIDNDTSNSHVMRHSVNKYINDQVDQRYEKNSSNLEESLIDAYVDAIDTDDLEKTVSIEIQNESLEKGTNRELRESNLRKVRLIEQQKSKISELEKKIQKMNFSIRNLRGEVKLLRYKKKLDESDYTSSDDDEYTSSSDDEDGESSSSDESSTSSSTSTSSTESSSSSEEEEEEETSSSEEEEEEEEVKTEEVKEEKEVKKGNEGKDEEKEVKIQKDEVKNGNEASVQAEDMEKEEKIQKHVQVGEEKVVKSEDNKEKEEIGKGKDEKKMVEMEERVKTEEPKIDLSEEEEEEEEVEGEIIIISQTDPIQKEEEEERTEVTMNMSEQKKVTNIPQEQQQLKGVIQFQKIQIKTLEEEIDREKTRFRKFHNNVYLSRKKLFRIDHTEVQIGDEIAKGGFGVIYEGQYSINRTIAIKTLKLKTDHISTHERAELLKEVQDQIALVHPNILRVYGYSDPPGLPGERVIWILMEKMDCNLRQYIQQRSNRQRLTISEKIDIIRKITNAIHFCHTRDPAIIHNDIKSDNFLVRKHGKDIKLCDFGLVKKSQHGYDFVAETKRVGTVYWMSPEILKPNPEITIYSDIYALGITIFEILFERMPYQGCLLNKKEVVRNVCSKSVKLRPDISDPDLPKLLKKLLKRLWRHKPKKRMDTTKILKWIDEKEFVIKCECGNMVFPKLKK